MSTTLANQIFVTKYEKGACCIPGNDIHLRTGGLIPGCSLRKDGDRHFGSFRTIPEMVDALRSIPGEIYIVHTTMVKDPLEEYICGIPKRDPEAAQLRSLEAYLAFLQSRGLYTLPAQ